MQIQEQKEIEKTKSEKALAFLSKGSWAKELNELPAFLLGFGIAVGIALTVLGSLATGLGATTAGNTVNNVIGYFGQALNTFGYILILLVFVGAAYIILKDKKII